MPSAYTHLLLAKTFPEESKINDQDLGLLLQASMPYFQLGALGPDLPYSQLLGITDRKTAKIADKFHYENTNQIPILALNKIKMFEGELKDQAFSFFLGYMSHVVADGIIHPFVRDHVGDYHENQDEHRKLEMRLDVLFLDKLTKKSNKGLDLNYTNLHDQILDPLKNFSPISSMFSQLILEVYGEHITKDEVEEWVRDMHKVLEVAESSKNQFYANVPFIKDYLFHDLDLVIHESEKDLLLRNNAAKGRSTNFANRDIHFFDDCIPSFHRAFKIVALLAYNYVYENGSELNNQDFPAINLDTGRSLAFDLGINLDGKASYWEIA